MCEKYKCSKCIVNDSIEKKRKPKTYKPAEMFHNNSKKKRILKKKKKKKSSYQGYT